MYVHRIKKKNWEKNWKRKVQIEKGKVQIEKGKVQIEKGKVQLKKGKVQLKKGNRSPNRKGMQKSK